ncbi:MAG: SoxR reducing system RseC family protein [Candidatus Limivicinus sp.]|jgi:sigma-E factor negative regulatory protein RseC
MTNIGVVTKILPDSMAEVAVTRRTACGGNCSSCGGGCAYEGTMKTVASNRVNAKCGDEVVIESKSSKVYGAVILAYIMPIVLFLVGYAVAAAIGCSEGTCIVVSFLTLAVSAAVLILFQRSRNKKNTITFDIVQIN